ncbi:protein kinase [Streptomyces sp. MJP52]|uniref:protein kinase domain-containing protein n=1 Tax=Streptomyces sp. MJP52 TaxID=2940555 RepID=UPI00247581DC|nr:protein kinase [Streptomyces sp. MJP52]MDH6225972.1 serine/threonine protein kinase [Streptomyces sp. MJP52]
MAQQHPAQGPSDPEAAGGGMSDAPDNWGNGGLVGDGRYRLTRRLGRGGMAEVFAAEDVRLGRTVAVKLLRADLAEDPVSKARFTREAQSVAGLNHHAIVAVYDSGEDVADGSSVPYIVMELVEGRTIRELLIESEAPGPEQALIIVSGVLEALAYSHQHGIVHRDIKPANVIITHNGAVKVMDFGIARALHGAQSTMTQTGMVMGTPQYLSPEQALGKAVDHRSDLYATGCLLYELLALRPPFTGETPLSVVYQHVQDIPLPPSETGTQVPPELDGLVMRSLAKDPDDRFQTAEEMRGMVQYALEMLYEQGGHTGTWNTGPVLANGGGRGGGRGGAGATAATAMLPQGGHTRMGAGRSGAGSSTTQIPQPLIPSYNPGDDGAYTGGPGGSGSGRGKLLLMAALAVIAVVAGVALAMSNANQTDGKRPKKEPSVSQTSAPEKESESPAEESPEEEETADTGNGGQWDDWPSDDYTGEPTEDAESPTTGGTDGGSGKGGTTDGGTSSTNGGTSSTNGGTSSTNGGTTTDGTTTTGTTEGGETDGGGSNAGTTEGGETGDGGVVGDVVAGTSS